MIIPENSIFVNNCVTPMTYGEVLEQSAIQTLRIPATRKLLAFFYIAGPKLIPNGLLAEI